MLCGRHTAPTHGAHHGLHGLAFRDRVPHPLGCLDCWETAVSDCHFAVCIIYRHHERSHLSCGVLGAAWRSVFALISAASRTSSSAHSYSTSLSEAHTCLHLGTLSSTCQAQPQPLLVCFVAPLSLRCRCGRHAHIAGCGMGSRHGICPGRTHTSMRASGAASRRPARVIASAGEGGGARPRAAHEQLVGGGQGGCVLPSRTEGAGRTGYEGPRDDA